MEYPIKVLMVNYKMQCAGIESFIMNMYRNIDRNKVQFDFLVHYTEPQFYDNEIEALGGKIYRLSVREDNNFPKYLHDLKPFFEEHPEYKIVHGHMESFGCFYLKAAKNANVPIRIAQRNSGIKGFAKQILNGSFSKYATDLFACSEVAGEFLLGKDKKFQVYNNAIDTERYVYDLKVRVTVRQELNIKPEQFVVGHVGRFNTQKNHTFLLNMFYVLHQLNKNAVLLLAGEGDLQKEITEKAKKLCLDDCIIFLGVRRDMDRIYQAMDVFVLPSLFEGLPVSGIEAQASGLKCFFADTVTMETKMTEDVEFLSLDSSAKVWADEILKGNSGYTRKDNSLLIKKAGYDIKEQARNLQEFYLKRLGEV